MSTSTYHGSAEDRLAQICAKGEIEISESGRRIATITPAELRGVYDALPKQGPRLGEGRATTAELICRALHLEGEHAHLSNRKADRALQSLKRAGIATFDHASKCWHKRVPA